MRATGALATLMLSSLLLGAAPASAQGFFLSATDSRLRDDVVLLADEGVIRLPAMAWPMAVADVAKAIERVDVDSLHEPALQSALLRLRAVVAPRLDMQPWRIRELRVGAGRDSLLRDAASMVRDDLEAGANMGAQAGRWNLSISASAVLSPDDGAAIRLDGSDATLRVGNWLLGVNQLDRWWGPGRDGSLIWSTNARPMPALSIDRELSQPFGIPLLSWLGPWRFSGVLGTMDSRRPDVERPLFMGLRFSFQPLQILEVGLSRTAQFCGRGRTCNAETFWNVIAGRDNVGVRVGAEEEPGNQMAGIDFRIVSPFRSAPLALYAQLVGEDGSSTGIPERYLGLFGSEAWFPRDDGSVLRARVEYANTSCKFASPGENPDCAYRQGIFFGGYRYQGRNVGHTTDSDSESWAVTLSLALPDGEVWGLQFRHALLDRFGPPDTYNPVTFGPATAQAVSASWRGRLVGQEFSARVGVESFERAGSDRSVKGFGTLLWRLPL